MKLGAASEHGLALVEVLVALLIITLCLTALFQVVADSAVRARRSETIRAAGLVARSQITSAGIAYPLQNNLQGVEGPFVWAISAKPISSSGQSDAGVLWRVQVSVRLRSGGPVLVQLRSLRLAAG
ncbi:type II secretory pathway pseudopilin PulG [Rhizomicrobium palustre]|uniref:Type II secretory pathway pseudopilin PulG n=1 Tax=Rhizomicrobium palustre TaxID=189966 RepID=A0A846MZ88_9PROT|nr:hypothetical protein [Rhizomicrobium palustre]NIK88974.1 type II secretory pathway pseudopilin PulG [Rhizomicrobium palustre]